MFWPKSRLSVQVQAFLLLAHHSMKRPSCFPLLAENLITTHSISNASETLKVLSRLSTSPMCWKHSLSPPTPNVATACYRPDDSSRPKLSMHCSWTSGIQLTLSCNSHINFRKLMPEPSPINQNQLLRKMLSLEKSLNIIASQFSLCGEQRSNRLKLELLCSLKQFINS